jgi:hypothetical protein
MADVGHFLLLLEGTVTCKIGFILFANEKIACRATQPFLALTPSLIVIP